MNKMALFCDETENYVLPAEPKPDDTVVLRFRTAVADVTNVWLVVGNDEHLMKLEEKTNIFHYYCIEWHMTNMPFLYYFKVQSGDEVCYYTKLGVTEKYSDQPLFKIVPGFSTPEWAKGAVMYQIFVDRFYNGDPSNDVESGEYYYLGGLAQKVEDWEKPIAHVGIREFYGGDLQGIIDKLYYLSDLGVEVLYLNPIFVSPSNHKYDIQDYDYVDPHYGKIVHDGGEILEEYETSNQKATKYQRRVTEKENLEASNELLITLVEALHKRGMKLILDGVFNHCGSFNKWLDREKIYDGQSGYEKGAYLEEHSPYHSFFQFKNAESHMWPENESYDGWWGHKTLPKLNFEGSSELESYILSIGKKWVSPPYNIDGWRLDVAADLGYSPEYNHEFWKKFRNVVKEANPQALILAEHYGNPQSWLEGDQWDTVMNYDAFMEPLTWFLTGMEKHSDVSFPDLEGNGQVFKDTMMHQSAKLLYPSLFVSMNQLSNHDHSRFLTRTNHVTGRVEKLGAEAANQGVDKAVMRVAVVLQMTWVGAPTLYYGDEVGMCGFTDPDNRRSFPWGNEDQSLLEFHRQMIGIHRKYDVLKKGSLMILSWGNDMLAYARFSREEQIIVVINHKKENAQYKIPVWKAEVPVDATLERCMYTYENGYIGSADTYYVKEGNLYLNMGSESAIVLRVL